jgi:hypothetical protein
MYQIVSERFIQLCTELDAARTVSYIERTLRTNIHRHIFYVHCIGSNYKHKMLHVQYTRVVYTLTPDTTHIHILIVVGEKF